MTENRKFSAQIQNKTYWLDDYDDNGAVWWCENEGRALHLTDFVYDDVFDLILNKDTDHLLRLGQTNESYGDYSVKPQKLVIHQC